MSSVLLVLDMLEMETHLIEVGMDQRMIHKLKVYNSVCINNLLLMCLYDV